MAYTVFNTHPLSKDCKVPGASTSIDMAANFSSTDGYFQLDAYTLPTIDYLIESFSISVVSIAKNSYHYRFGNLGYTSPAELEIRYSSEDSSIHTLVGLASNYDLVSHSDSFETDIEFGGYYCSTYNFKLKSPIKLIGGSNDFFGCKAQENYSGLYGLRMAVSGTQTIATTSTADEIVDEEGGV